MHALSLIVALPLLGFLLNAGLGARLGNRFVTLVGCGLPIAAAGLAAWCFSRLVAKGAPLDETAFDPDAIEIEPSVPGATVRLWNDTINISGFKKGRTRYTVTIPAATKDKFGQTLEKVERVTFEVGPAEETLFGLGKELVTLDPSGGLTDPDAVPEVRRTQPIFQQV